MPDNIVIPKCKATWPVGIWIQDLLYLTELCSSMVGLELTSFEYLFRHAKKRYNDFGFQMTYMPY